eukprot:5621885-Prymnesium_polylepis.1
MRPHLEAAAHAAAAAHHGRQLVGWLLGVGAGQLVAKRRQVAACEVQKLAARARRCLTIISCLLGQRGGGGTTRT